MGTPASCGIEPLVLRRILKFVSQDEDEQGVCSSCIVRCSSFHLVPALVERILVPPRPIQIDEGDGTIVQLSSNTNTTQHMMIPPTTIFII